MAFVSIGLFIHCDDGFLRIPFTDPSWPFASFGNLSGIFVFFWVEFGPQICESVAKALRTGGGDLRSQFPTSNPANYDNFQRSTILHLLDVASDASPSPGTTLQLPIANGPSDIWHVFSVEKERKHEREKKRIQRKTTVLFLKQNLLTSISPSQKSFEFPFLGWNSLKRLP